MPRGAMYDDGVPHSDNAIEQGETKAHGVNPEHGEDIGRAHKTAQAPEDIADPNNKQFLSGLGSRGTPPSGSGKGGHDPKTLGERKGLGAHKADGPDF